MSPVPPQFSRRDLLKGAGAAAVAGAVLPAAIAQDAAAPAGLTRLGPGPVPVAFTLNGKKTTIQAEPRATLLDTLRDGIGLTGAKRICDRGACGGCTVFLDGKPVNSCLVLMPDVAGATVTTIEGITPAEGLHPVQAAFVREDALQCGFCTPGMVMSCVALLQATPKPTDEQIRTAVAGNLCRCGTYPHVFNACRAVAGGK